jgi:Ni/Fe-hydrogenase subunit HybB-like protein
MKKIAIYKSSLILSFLLTVTGAFFKISHYSYGNPILSIGMAIGWIYIIMGLTDVFRNRNYKPLERIMWLTSFIVFSLIAGIIYLPKYKLRNK